MPYKAIVIGVSAGGLTALKTILPALSFGFAFPIAIVQHRNVHSDNFLAEYLNRISKITVKEAEDKEPLCAGHAYLAPAGYHLHVESNFTFSLSMDDRVNYSCPSIDVLFESAADVFAKLLVGIILTGANADGAHGLKTLKDRGGLAIVQNPEMAEADVMPKAALAATSADYVLDLEQITQLLNQLSKEKEKSYGTNG